MSSFITTKNVFKLFGSNFYETIFNIYLRYVFKNVRPSEKSRNLCIFFRSNEINSVYRIDSVYVNIIACVFSFLIVGMASIGARRKIRIKVNLLIYSIIKFYALIVSNWIISNGRCVGGGQSYNRNRFWEDFQHFRWICGRWMILDENKRLYPLPRAYIYKPPWKSQVFPIESNSSVCLSERCWHIQYKLQKTHSIMQISGKQAKLLGRQVPINTNITVAAHSTIYVNSLKHSADAEKRQNTNFLIAPLW